jgi:hypothetical protein
LGAGKGFLTVVGGLYVAVVVVGFFAAVIGFFAAGVVEVMGFFAAGVMGFFAAGRAVVDAMGAFWCRWLGRPCWVVVMWCWFVEVGIETCIESMR